MSVQKFVSESSVLVLWHWRALLTFNQSAPPHCCPTVATFCRFVQVACTNLLQHGCKWYSALCRNCCMTVCATSSYTLDIALACSITHHISIVKNSRSFLKFPLSGKLLQTMKLLTCCRATSASWNTTFQLKDNKLHTECKSYDTLWRVQYGVYAS